MDLDAMERLANAGVTHLSDVKALLAEVRALRERLEIDPGHPYDGIYCRDETIRLQGEEIERLREIQAANVEIKMALHMKTLDLAEEKIALKTELNAWRERFPAHVYRPQDDCVANRFWLERRQPDEEPK
jgi:FtsZ-binding cell division protein ZapB